MAKKRSVSSSRSAQRQVRLSVSPGRRSLFLMLPRLLRDEAEKAIHRGPRQDRAHEIIKKWVELESQGHLQRKETSLDADFLLEVFNQALGYQVQTDSPEGYCLDRNFTVPGVGTADGALGRFAHGQTPAPVAVIELKGADTDLDRDRFNGRTPVQQCWDYLNALPQCPWGIVSNYKEIRLYHRNRTQLSCEKFTLQQLREPARFRQFYCVFERGGLIGGTAGHTPTALRLVEETENRQREVGDELYEYYSTSRLRLIEHLQSEKGKSRQQAIHIAQKLIDRIIFVAFCEDRDLIPDKSINRTYSTIPPFTKVTNPRWRNFLGLFHAMNEGHNELLYMDNGFNGGLFKYDAEVDDLQLGDEWTHFFRGIGEYDFRDEVNVDLLGHLFERSVSELERLRSGPLFAAKGVKAPSGDEPRMPKSRERKTFGTYYTPPELTQFLVERALTPLIDELFESIREKHGLQNHDLDVEDPDPALGAYWRDCFDALSTLKVCDPACGSGAFLIQAYDVLELRYRFAVDQIVKHAGVTAESLVALIPDRIVADNIYGVDLSEQSVEITQLALWLRTARRGRTLADLSGNIVWGNSLVTDPAVHPKAIDWPATFPGVFGRTDRAGFDCVVGNPPWERIKLQEREFFSFSAPKIAAAVSAAERRRLIGELEATLPELYREYLEAQTTAEKTLAHVRESGRYPLTGKGDINFYVLFAELAKKIVAPRGRVGLLVPSGIATDSTTREFFAELVESKALICLFDFENRLKIFPDVDGRFKFCTLVFGGSQIKTASVDFAFFAHRVEDLEDKDRHIRLSSKDLQMVNPNSRTCPIFRTRRDAELTKAIYRRVPILIDQNRREGGNPLGYSICDDVPPDE
ncbi:MAG: hypothetical protein EXS05_03595 [Planctomycetaceae bacterium]|nr:hypothetical protein [Planctomycetaceae bacterium]